MSALGRWTDEGAFAEERALLKASRREAPDPAARLRTLRALGLDGPLGGAPPPAGGSAARGGAWLKLVVAGTLGGALVVGGLWGARPRPASPAPAAATAVVAAAQESPPSPTAPVDAEPGPSTSPPAPVRRRRPHNRAAPAAELTAPPVVTNAAPQSSQSTLAAEVAALEIAHGALARRDPDTALGALDGYRARFPHGRLATEESLLRVQALLARGDVAAAGALASAFAAVHPESSYARQMQDLVRDADATRKKN